MESIIKKILPRSIGLPKKLPKLDMDLTFLEEQRLDMDQRIERMQATLNGEDDWMLCLTRNRKVCEEGDSK